MTKKITLLFILICLFLISCSTDIEINDPALQAKIDGELFRSSFKKAVIYDDGTLVISGSSGDKSISFTTTSTKVGTYMISQNTIDEISFKNDKLQFVSKNQETEGEVTITEVYNNEISGKFNFKNLKDENGNISNFSDGWFYRLPLENGIIEEETTEQINPCLLNASLTAMVNGSEMITDNHSASLYGVDNASILIKAANENQEIIIVFKADVTPGQYSLTGSGDFSASYALNNDKSSALSGQIIITNHDINTKCISGSFEFNTRSNAQISEGFFEFGY